jgi:steroid 5-alpha reductase family enzyme
MIFRDGHERSFLPKLFVAMAMLASVLLSTYLMFAESSDMTESLKPYKIQGDSLRHIFLSSCFIIYFLRLMATMFVFFQRKMYWMEAVIITSLMPWFILYLARVGGKNEQPVGMVEIGGLLLFLFGSYLNTASEYSRHTWKKKNTGHLYTRGWFKHVRHVNYLGDILLFTGIAAVSHSFAAWVVPASMTLIFVVVLIPLKERYLKNKYGPEFNRYASTTRKLVPMLY